MNITLSDEAIILIRDLLIDEIERYDLYQDFNPERIGLLQELLTAFNERMP